MPIFEYACKKCGKEFEALVLKTTPAPSCPKCKSTELEKPGSEAARVQREYELNHND